METQTSLTKKERKELKRQEKIKGRETAIKKWRLKRVVYWGISLVLIGLLIYVLILAANQKPTPLLGESFPIQGQQHIEIDASHPAYNSNPPTSGSHYATPASWGVYQNELPDEQLVHKLEHGGIWISYKGIDTTTKSSLEKITQTHAKIIIEPREKDDAPIVLVSWGQLLKLQMYDEQKILDFIKTNSNRSPEPFAQ